MANPQEASTKQLDAPCAERQLAPLASRLSRLAKLVGITTPSEIMFCFWRLILGEKSGLSITLYVYSPFWRRTAFFGRVVELGLVFDPAKTNNSSQ